MATTYNPLALIPSAVALLLISTQIPLVINPVSFSAPFIKVETTQSVFYLRQLGFRNLQFGVVLAVLVYRGQLSGAATVLSTYPLLSCLDPIAGYLYRGHFVKNDGLHVFTGFLFGGLGWWMSNNL